MKVLVTGGAGYIGSILVGQLLASGHQVMVLDNFMYGQMPLAQLCWHPSLSIVRGDARDIDTFKPLHSFDAVIPLAAIVGAPACDADSVAAMTTNEEAIGALCRGLLGWQRLIIPISNSGYGIGEDGKECTEDSPLNPISLYGRTKVGAEMHALERENSISLRLATVFGMSPRMRLDLLVNDFVYRAVTDRSVVLFEPHFKRNFIHVRDVASAFVRALDRFDSMKGRAYNVGLSEANLSKLQLCERISQWLPDFQILQSNIGHDPDKRDYIVSNARIERTGWRPQFSLDAGIIELIKGYQMIRNSAHGNA